MDGDESATGTIWDPYVLLTEGTVESLQQIPWGSNYTFCAALRREDAGALAIYKPMRGERPLWDFPSGTLYLRERAAYLTSQALGWSFVPLTVVRDGPHGVGSMQLYVEAEPLPSFQELGALADLDLARIAAFDLITNNADRKGGHILRDGQGKLWGIDHGLCFNVEPKVRTVLQHFCGGTVPTEVREELRAFEADPQRVASLAHLLDGVIAAEEFAVFLGRVRTLASSGVYPRLDHYRSVPWPNW
ncbi:MAG: SCO1664 family protein [Chloroflexi bacterium]|nr:SCO1664 family protein [Chloroflexota bacterium]